MQMDGRPLHHGHLNTALTASAVSSGEEGTGPWGLLDEGADPIVGGSPSQPDVILKAPNAVTLKACVSTYKFGRMQTSSL